MNYVLLKKYMLIYLQSRTSQSDLIVRDHVFGPKNNLKLIYPTTAYFGPLSNTVKLHALSCLKTRSECVTAILELHHQINLYLIVCQDSRS